MQDNVAIAFLNTFGNLIFLSSAVKVLRNWGYTNIDLLTDLNTGYAIRDKILIDYGSKIFNNVRSKFNRSDYKKIFHCGWSFPSFVDDHEPLINWQKTGVHEISVYLNMIGASWRDFDGYIFPVADKPKLPKTSKIRIALANASGSEQANKKKWDKFPELSRKLKDLGFEVILVGLKGELDKCNYDYNYCGRSTIYETAKIIEQCDILIGSSTALTIVADVVKTPVLLLEGPMCTNRAHPIQSKYEIVRKYISCAPCFQTGFWKLCKKSYCMEMIKSDDVIAKLFKLLKKPDKLIEINPDRKYQVVSSMKSSVKDLKRRAAYLVSVSNRYHTTKEFFESFISSNPLPGRMYIFNDRSIDPRIDEYIHKLRIRGIIIKKYKNDISFKETNGIASTRVGNFLLEKIKNDRFNYDYLVYLDSDIIFKSYWLQQTILTYEEAKTKHKLWGATPLNNKFDKFNIIYRDPAIYCNSISKYRLRGGMSICFIIEKEFIDLKFGYYDTTVKSSDISKSNEMAQKGYYGLVTVPSLVQHIGVLDSSFRNRIGVFAEDF